MPVFYKKEQPPCLHIFVSNACGVTEKISCKLVALTILSVCIIENSRWSTAPKVSMYYDLSLDFYMSCIDMIISCVCLIIYKWMFMCKYILYIIAQ